MKHYLNKDKFLAEMQKRGWILHETLHTWIRPASRTQHEAEQNWIDSIVESIECPHEQPQHLATGQVTYPGSSETLKNA